MPRHGPIQGKPSSRLRLPDHAITILPPPLADLVVRDSKLSSLIRTELVDDRTGKTVGLTFFFFILNLFFFFQQDSQPRSTVPGLDLEHVLASSAAAQTPI